MEKKWWHGKVAYQIYPKSFKDGNGDGTGDLAGIREKLPYLKELGIDLLWLSPVYKSPFADNGYDISDYRDIDPVFGSLDEFKSLLQEAKALGIDLVMDLVLNHCSDEHEWFKKACQDPTCEEAGYFYFVKSEDGKVPSNMRSYFGGSIWEPVPGHKDLLYSHYFAKKQPDLNWHNPKLRQEIYDLVNFWIDLGVKGFRIDAILSVVKDLSFPSLPADAPDGMCHVAKLNAKLLPKIGEYLNELKEKTFDRADCFTVGEALTVTEESVREFTGDGGYFSTLFDLSCREVIESAPHYPEYPEADFAMFKNCVTKTQLLYCKEDSFTAPICENHDEPRGVSYFMPEKLRNAKGAKVLAVLLMMLRGIPFIYQGQELGMTNTDFNSADEFDDIFAKDELRLMKERGFSDDEAVKICARHSRDNARTPMPWNDGKNGGFSEGKPWIRLYQDYAEVNAASQVGNPDSVFSCYKDLIALRKREDLHETVTYGDFRAVDSCEEVMAYSRNSDGLSLLVAGSVSADLQKIQLPAGKKAELLYTAGNAKIGDDGALHLTEGSAAIVKLS